MKSHKGFTLIELAIVVIIIGVLATIAVPSLRYYIQNVKSTSLADVFVSSLGYARSEAVTRNTPVSICPTVNNGTTCSGNAADWVSGWMIFVDPNADGVYSSTTDTLIKVQESLGSGVVFGTTRTRVTYTSMGFISAGNATYTMSASGCSGNNARTVTLSTTGDVQITAAAC